MMCGGSGKVLPAVTPATVPRGYPATASASGDFGADTAGIGDVSPGETSE